MDAEGYIHLDHIGRIGNVIIEVEDDLLLTFEQFNNNYIPERPQEVMPRTYVDDGIIFLN